MAFYQFTATQKIPASIEQVWDFISSPNNLKEITPAYMGFEITSPGLPEKMYPGMIISYKLSPLLGIKMTWVTEITQVEHHRYFVDEQRIGPYSLWHHQHHFKAVPGGVEMTDLVHYRLPLGILGKLAHVLFVKKQLQTIFDYRIQKLGELFG